MNIWRSSLLIALLGFWPSYPAQAQTVTFDFDSGTPTLFTGQSVPFDQTFGGVTAHFSSPQGSVFSVQTDASTHYQLSQFSGNYLYPNNLDRNYLDIKFSKQIRRITLTFATADTHQTELPTAIQLTAYADSTGTPPVGSTTTRGTYGTDTFPMGTLSFTSSKPFNLVEIVLPPQPLGITDFLVDNITVNLSPSVDFNADTKPDILLQDTVSGDKYVWYMNGTTITGGDYIYRGGQTWQVVGPK